MEFKSEVSSEDWVCLMVVFHEPEMFDESGKDKAWSVIEEGNQF